MYWTGALSLVALTMAATPGHPQQASTITSCRVREVLRGDAFRCTDGRSVRLLLIEAPGDELIELARRSHEALQTLIPAGTPLRLEFDVDVTDGYGHTLAYA